MAKKSSRALAKVIPITQARPRAPQPIVVKETKIVQAKKASPKKHHSNGGGKASIQDAMLSAGALRFIENSSMGAMIPNLPVGGKAGTVGVILYFLGGKWRRYALGPLAVATYNAVGGLQQGGVQGWAQPGVAAQMG
jgi:hypothetical protein